MAHPSLVVQITETVKPGEGDRLTFWMHVHIRSTKTLTLESDSLAV